MLYLAAREWYKAISFQKVEDALSEEIRDYTNMVSEIKAIAEVYTFVAVVFVIV